MIRLAVVGQVHLAWVNVARDQGGVAHAVRWWWRGLVRGSMMGDMVRALDALGHHGALDVDDGMDGEGNAADVDWGHVQHFIAAWMSFSEKKVRLGSMC